MSATAESCSVMYNSLLTAWTVADEVPQSMEFSRQETRVGSHFAHQYLLLFYFLGIRMLFHVQSEVLVTRMGMKVRYAMPELRQT